MNTQKVVRKAPLSFACEVPHALYAKLTNIVENHNENQRTLNYRDLILPLYWKSHSTHNQIMFYYSLFAMSYLAQMNQGSQNINCSSIRNNAIVYQRYA